MSGTLEVHSHSFVSGPRCGGHYEKNGWHTGTFSHSHEEGNVPHEHPHTGPACYRATGLRGGGRKKFTAKPSGEQLPYIAKDPESFEVIICGDPTPELGEGPGIALPERIAQTFKAPYTIRDARSHRA